MNIVADTNIFRGVYHEDFSMLDVIKSGEELWVSPVTVLELLGGISDANFSSRQGAARTIQNSGAKMLLDPVYEITEAFGFEFAEDPFDWMVPLNLLADASNLEELYRGQPRSGKLYHINVDAISDLEQGAELWLKDRVGSMDDSIASFKRWWETNRSKGKAKPKMPNEEREAFEEYLQSTIWFGAEMLQLLAEARTMAKNKGREPVTKELALRFAAAGNQFYNYIQIRTQYTREMFTTGLNPQANDMVDLDLFVYTRKADFIVATKETRWKNLTARAGCSHLLRTVGAQP